MKMKQKKPKLTMQEMQEMMELLYGTKVIKRPNEELEKNKNKFKNNNERKLIWKTQQ